MVTEAVQPSRQLQHARVAGVRWELETAPPPITLLLFPGCAVNESQTQEAADIKTCPPAWGRAPEIMSICDGSVRLAPDSDVCSGSDLTPSQS